MTPKGCYLYALYDRGAPFYIGKGQGHRAHNHIGEARRGSRLPAHKKIRSMRHAPEIKILVEGLAEEEAYELEELAITTVGRRMDGSGPLLNLSVGGRGGTSGYVVKLTPEQHAKRNAAIRSPEVRAKISKGVRSSTRTLTPEGRAALSRAHKGKVPSAETRVKISKAKKGKPGWKHTVDSKAKIAASNRRRIVSKETKRRISESVKRKPLTEEQKAKRRAAVLKLVKCPHCAKEGARSIMLRWHFDNCKQKGN